MDRRDDWFKNARFGMFLHWGIMSLPGDASWKRMGWYAGGSEFIPVDELKSRARKFIPAKFDPREWARLADDAGMKYMVLTTRHHDGYALFDSKVSDFTAPKTGPAKDLVAEFVEACREKNIKIGFYYSLKDWMHPAWFRGPERDPEGWDQFCEYVHTQVRELCTNYGRIDTLWYDGGWLGIDEDGWKNRAPETWRAVELNAMVRELQPHILINDRSGTPEDIGTPEQTIPVLWKQRLMNPDFDPDRAWETCMTMNDSWFYQPGGHWKSTSQLIHNLGLCVQGGGNYLLNVGPEADGSFPPKAVDRLREIGIWMRANGESIYGTEPCPFRGGAAGPTTAKGSTAYLHAVQWPGETTSILGVRNRVLSARILATGEKVDVEQTGYTVKLGGLPTESPDPHDTVIALEMDGKPQSYPVSFMSV